MRQKSVPTEVEARRGTASDRSNAYLSDTIVAQLHCLLYGTDRDDARRAIGPHARTLNTSITATAPLACLAPSRRLPIQISTAGAPSSQQTDLKWKA